MLNLLLFLTFLAFVAIFAGYEIAYITTDRKRIDLWFKIKEREAEQRKRPSRLAKLKKRIRKNLRTLLVQHPERVLTTDLIGTNFAAVGAAVFLTKWLMETLPEGTAIGGAGVITTITILLLGEILPKSFARENAEWIVRRFSTLIFVTYILSFPVSVLIQRVITKAVVKESKSHKKFEKKLKDEIEKLVIIGETRGFLSKRESFLLKTVLHSYEMKVDWFMIPLKELVAVPINKPIKDILIEAQKREVQKILVYKKNLDDFLGIVPIVELLYAYKSGIPLKNMVKEVPVVYRDWTVQRAVNEMEKKKADTAIVIGEFGDVVGILDYQCIIDEILDALKGSGIKKVKDGWIVDGDVLVSELAEITGIDLPTDEETVGRALLTALENAAETEEERKKGHVDLGNWHLEVYDGLRDESGQLLVVKKVLIKQKSE